MNEMITIETHVLAPIEKVWHDFNDPEAIKAWNAASEDWHTTRVSNDLRTGGAFSYRMEAKDGSVGFDLSGVYDEVIMHERLAYTLEDGRKVEVVFTPDEGGVHIKESFEPETENAHEFQRSGWQSILDSFKKYSEASAA